MDTGVFAEWVESFEGGLCRVTHMCCHAKSCQFTEASSNGSTGVVWDMIGGWPWSGCWCFGEEGEINTELLMFVPSIDLFLCLPFILLVGSFSFFLLFPWLMAEPGSPVCSKTLCLIICKLPANPLTVENRQTQNGQSSVMSLQVECFRMFSCWAS